MNNQSKFTTTTVAILYIAAIVSSLVLLTNHSNTLTLGFKIACAVIITIAAYRIGNNIVFLFKNRSNIANARKQFNNENRSQKETQERDRRFKVYRAKNLGKYKQHTYLYGLTMEAKTESESDIAYKDLTKEQKKAGGYYTRQGNQTTHLDPSSYFY